MEISFLLRYDYKRLAFNRTLRKYLEQPAGCP